MLGRARMWVAGALVIALALPAVSIGPAHGAVPAANAANAALAERLLEVQARGGEDLARTIRLADAAFGTERAPAGMAFADARAAVEVLLARHDAAADPAALDAVASLDPAVDAALARLIGAFLAYDDAAGRALASVPAPDLAAAARAHLAMPAGDAAPDPGADTPLARILAAQFPAVVAARAHLLDAALQLRDVLAGAPVQAVVLDAAPALALDLVGVDSTYTAGVALLVDAGGRDTYRNNAGGSNVLRAACGGLLEVPVQAAAAALDFAGDDAYLGPGGPTCGANGGAYVGAGLLLDAAGDDVYSVDGAAVNGGAALGVGLLLDAGGRDRYVGGNTANGGGTGGGQGALFDAGGDDVYEGRHFGVNGGASYWGTGLLVDADGADRYLARSAGVNGGAYGRGATAALLDLGGDDLYGSAPPEPGWLSSVSIGGNGGAYIGATAFLFDASGDDRYDGGVLGTNGGALGGATGTLWDVEGNDVYRAVRLGANGEGDIDYLYYPFIVDGVGLLLDGGGTDVFTEDSGTCANPSPCTVLPKGTGAQLDL